MALTKINPGKIQIKEEKWSETCVTEKNLVENQVKYPAIRQLIEYADQRMLSTLIVSGVDSQFGIGYIKSKVGDAVERGKFIGNNAYQFDVQGRIQKASVINSQIGATQANGTFQLSMKDNYLVPGMNALFHAQGFQARVMSLPSGSAGNYIYTFQSPDGRLFDWNIHAAGQQGAKTCFGGYTSYSDKSLRGYGRSHFTSAYVQHMTTQRKTMSIAGGAGSTVLWINYEKENGDSTSGWLYKEVTQAKSQLMIEDEYQKWFGLSSMKGDNGELLAESRMIDLETGLPIVQGDGITLQIDGGNYMEGSGITGDATIDDVIDMMTFLEKKCTQVMGKVWYIVTGTDGYATLQRLFRDYAHVYNITTLMVSKDGQAQIGGQMIDVGFHFASFNINGNKVVVVKHPLFDDEERFTERGSDGKLSQSSQMIFLDLSGSNGRSNMEILSKGGNGFKRDLVTAELNGLTGKAGVVLTQEDATTFAMLKENMIVLFNTTSCGIINKAA